MSGGNENVTDITFLPGIPQRTRNAVSQRRPRPRVSFLAGRVMLMLTGPDKAALPRDTIVSAIMIPSNAVVGLCLLVGGLRHRELAFHVLGRRTS